MGMPLLIASLPVFIDYAWLLSIQEVHSEAAGQVSELTTYGRLLIQWADNTKTYCYPQELYLIGDEVGTPLTDHLT